MAGKTHINWQTPEQMANFEWDDNNIILVENKDNTFTTEMLIKDTNGSLYLDVPLMSFSFREFSPDNYLRLAVVETSNKE